MAHLAEAVDPSYVLAVRLMFRRWSDRKRGDVPGRRFNASINANKSAERISCNRDIGDGDCSKPIQVGGLSPSLPSDSDKSAIHTAPVSPMPSVDWDLFEMLHTEKVSGDSSKEKLSEKFSTEQQRYDAAIEAFCQVLMMEFRGNKSDEKCSLCWDGSWITKDNFDDVIGKVKGCGHAITDVTLPLGEQILGRALFLPHSFYNHSCVPNAFLSCEINDGDFHGISTRMNSRGGEEHSSCALIARVHCLKDVGEGEPVTLSYIPTSGLDRAERQRRLHDGYSFKCVCGACGSGGISGMDALASTWERALKVPDGSDIDALREVQYSCNRMLLQVRDMVNPSREREAALASCLGMIRMSFNGIENQAIPSSHEVSVEARRLLAAALSVSGKTSEAIGYHRQFFSAVNPVRQLFDPIALATQHCEFAADLWRDHHEDETEGQLRDGLKLALAALGSDHQLVVSIEKRLTYLVHQRERKRTRLN